MFLKGLKGLIKSKETIKGNGVKPPKWAETRVGYLPKKCIKCHLCVKYCPAVAISVVKDGFVHVNDEMCIRCSICTEVCPTKALVMKND